MGMRCWGSSDPHSVYHRRSAARWAAPFVPQVFSPPQSTCAWQTASLSPACQAAYQEESQPECAGILIFTEHEGPIAGLYKALLPTPVQVPWA